MRIIAKESVVGYNNSPSSGRNFLLAQDEPDA